MQQEENMPHAFGAHKTRDSLGRGLARVWAFCKNARAKKGAKAKLEFPEKSFTLTAIPALNREVIFCIHLILSGLYNLNSKNH